MDLAGGTSNIMIGYVVVPTYNERDNLRELCDRIFALGVPGLRILVVDDDSPDGTGDLAERLVIDFADQIEVLHRSGKQGLGSAYRQAFALALANDADYVIQMDADLSHPPELIPVMLENLE